MKACGAAAATTASAATFTPPSVPFLKPTGQDRPRPAGGGSGSRWCGADGAPAHQVGDVLRREQVQELGAGRQAQGGQVQQQAAGLAQAFVHAEAAVQPRVVDEALPAHRGAGLLEVDPHHDDQFAGQFLAQHAQLLPVGQGLLVVVDGAGAHHHDQAVVLAGQHAGDVGPAALHHRLGLAGERHLVLQQGRRDQRPHRADAQVVHPGGVQRAFQQALLLGVQGRVHDFGTVQGTLLATTRRGKDGIIPRTAPRCSNGTLPGIDPRGDCS
jgi:hypothetical protein